jgi:hypothetical protein
MNLIDLKNDIEATPALSQALSEDNIDFIVNEYAKDHPTETKSVEYMFNKRIFYRNLGMATALPIIAALEAQSQSADLMTSLQAREVLLLLDDLNAGGGVDAAHAETRGMCMQLRDAGVMSAETCDEIRDWGEVPVSVGFVIFGEEVSVGDVKQCKGV